MEKETGPGVPRTAHPRAPSNEDEAGLRRLAAQIKARKVVVKLFLRHTLHAKLYLLFRPDPDSPVVGYLGSSNLTFAGLSGQGELNVDVLDHDACAKLAHWFNDRWDDRWCIDISDELVQIIDESWAREPLISPYHMYLKMAYHLAQEALAGLSEFRIPAVFRRKLFEFQSAAVRIAARHLNKRGGVLIGDVVGLGKTLIATALARIFEDNFDLETLIICPRNLTAMWQEHRERYGLRGRVLSLSMAPRVLPHLRPYRLVIIDESHNLRNREGRRYRAIYEYVRLCNSKVILLSATPYNKSYVDLGSQLRLFVPEDHDLGVRPEKLLHELGVDEFTRRHQCPLRSLAAFEKSPHADDWRDLMRLYLVRRTRTFIKANYAADDPATGRKCLTFEDGTKAYFPDRRPKTVKFKIGKATNDPYARLYAEEVVDVINHLNLPRYGLGTYLPNAPNEPPTPAEAKVILDLSRRANGSRASAARTCSSASKAAARPSCNRSSGTSSATPSSCTPSIRGWTYPSARRTRNCSTPAWPTPTAPGTPANRAPPFLPRRIISGGPPKSTSPTPAPGSGASSGSDPACSSISWPRTSARTSRPC